MKVALSFACIALFYFLMETTTEAKTDSTFRNSNGDILFRSKFTIVQLFVYFAFCVVYLTSISTVVEIRLILVPRSCWNNPLR